MGPAIWSTSWSDVGRIVITALVGYLVLLFYIRFYGKRVTSRMNNFDWIITVAVGSVFASMVVLKNVSMVNGLIALGLLLTLQFVLTYATSRWSWARSIILSSPRLLYYDDRFDHATMRAERVAKTEIMSAIRESGAGSLDEVLAVTLESDAELSVVKKSESDRLEALEPLVRRFRERHGGQ